MQHTMIEWSSVEVILVTVGSDVIGKEKICSLCKVGMRRGDERGCEHKPLYSLRTMLSTSALLSFFACRSD